MNIHNTQTPTPQASVETLVGNQRQEFPKPSIPPEDVITNPVEKEYNGKVNEAKNTVESDLKNAQQTAKEEEMNATPSLTDMQSLALKANTTQNKIEAYAAGAGKDIESDVANFNIQASQQSALQSANDLRELQETINKQKGVQTYIENMGMNGIMS